MSVTTDRAVYRPGEVIHAEVRNEGARDVYAASGQSFCTIAAVERSAGGVWRPVARCEQGAPPGFVRIAAGKSLALELPPPGASTDGLSPGTYRLRCSLAVGSPGGPSVSARSPAFTVAPS